MLESFILGAIQGVFEWLPVSSEGLIVLVKSNFFPGGSLEATIKFAFFIHLGTFFAALIYFQKEVKNLVSTLLCPSTAEKENKAILKFIAIATIVSGLLGYFLLKIIASFEDQFAQSAKYINLIIGLLLVVTGALQLKAKKISAEKIKKEKDLGIADSWIVGIMQGFSSLPGLSRSGLTVAGLLFRKYNQETALSLSFLLSLPIVFLANIVLNFEEIISLDLDSLTAVLTAFLFGLVTIHALLKIARKINFAYFIFLFAGFLVVSFFV